MQLEQMAGVSSPGPAIEAALATWRAVRNIRQIQTISRIAGPQLHASIED